MSTVFSGDEGKINSCSYTKETPFIAKLSHRILLSKNGSSKKTFHVTLDISGSNINYEEGDAIAILPSNCPKIVSRFLELSSLNGDEIINHPRKEEKQPILFKEYLTYKANLSKISPGFFDLIKEASNSTAFKTSIEPLSEDRERKKIFIDSHDIISLLESCSGIEVTAQRAADQLLPLLPRFYSIASSSKVNKNLIDLLVATLCYEVRGEIRHGIGSDFLCNRADELTNIPIYHQPNPNFKLPQDDAIPIIMIGPGTGLAPFRGFLQKRINLGSSQKNWLFFGERHQNTDFYYEDELLSYQAQNRLKLSLAFSRDSENKTYVQHLMMNEKLSLWKWIEDGAMIYLCGDAKSMAKEVTETFLKIFECVGNLTQEESRQLLHKLRKEKRFQADVY